MGNLSVKSYITLCAVGILYIIMAAVAVLSPHGRVFAGGTMFTTPLSGIKDCISFTDKQGIEVSLPLEGMPVFRSTKLSVVLGSETKMYTGAEFSTIVTWTGFKKLNENTIVTITDGKGVQNVFAYSVLSPDNAAYICYANENGEPLDKNGTGYFCFAISSGEETKFITDVRSVVFSEGANG